MSQARDRIVKTKDGSRGTIKLWPINQDDPRVLIQFSDGQQTVVSSDALALEADGTYSLAYSREELQRQAGISAFNIQTDLADRVEATQTSKSVQTQQHDNDDTRVIPLVVERAVFEKRRVETGTVRLHKSVRERQELIDQPLYREEVQIEHVPVNRIVSEAATPRTEGNTLIVPVLEQILVVEKRLLLKEQLRITKRQVEYHEPQRITLRREEVELERSPGQSVTSGQPGANPAYTPTNQASQTEQLNANEERIIPVIVEELNIQKERVETEVRLSKVVSEQEETVDQPLYREEVHVERVPVNRVVNEPAAVRYEGETMIMPLYEEVVAVERRLRIIEELHITRRQVEYHEPQRVTLRSEEVQLERIPVQ